MKCVAGRAGEHRGSQAGFPALWLGRQHRFPGGCAAVSQLISAALALFFPKILPHSPVRAFCFPPSLMMLFQSHLFVPVLPRPAQHQLLAPHSHSLTAPTLPKFLGDLCKNSPSTCNASVLDKITDGLSGSGRSWYETTEKPHGSAQKHNWSF